jgi:hypothetical protein
MRQITLFGYPGSPQKKTFGSSPNLLHIIQEYDDGSKEKTCSIRWFSQFAKSELEEGVSIYCYGRWFEALLFLIAGESGLGKSTLINTLFSSAIYPEKEEKELTMDTVKTVEIQAISIGIF